MALRAHEYALMAALRALRLWGAYRWYAERVKGCWMAQFDQDRLIVERLGGRRGGWFVEIGGGDGVVYSNTLALERHLGWTGLLIEPGRLGEHAPRHRRCQLSRAFVASEPGLEAPFTEVLLAEASADLRYDGRHAALSRVFSLPPRALRTRTLEQELRQAGAPDRIDLLSLDTEGSELDVLRGVDWGRRRFSLILVEHNLEAPKREAIRAYLEARGYRLAARHTIDDLYEPVTAAPPPAPDPTPGSR